MTSYGAYDAGLPCKNPNCRSHGRPHPNCRCYSGMADGGDVHFCAQDRAHQPDCEYYAEGTPDGVVGEEIDPSQVQIDEPAPVPSPSPEPEEPEQDIDPAKVAMDAPEIPNEEVALDSEKPTFSVPESGDDLGQRIATKGLLQEPPTEYGEGEKIPMEDWQKLGQEYEENSKAGALITGGAGIAQIGKIADAAAAYTGMNKVGATVLSRAIASGLIGTGDEVSKWMLGQGDPVHPVGAALANIWDDILYGTAFGSAEAAGAKTLKVMAATKAAGKLSSFLAGVGAAAQHAPDAEMSAGLKTRDYVDEAIKDYHNSDLAHNGASLSAYKTGQRVFDKGMSAAIKSASTAASTKAGYMLDGVPGAMAGVSLAGGMAEPIKNYVENLVRPSARKYVAPVVMKILSSGNTAGLIDALKFAEQAGAGDKAATQAVNSIMSGAAAKLGNATARSKDKIKKWISDGGIGQEIQQELYNQNAPEEIPAFAKGGEVKHPEPAKSDGPGVHQHSGLALHYPEQNMMLAAARGRVSNYLTALKPGDHDQRLPFDDAPDQTEKKRSYERALDIAASPLSILDEISRGTLEPDHMRHFNSMHPELGSLLNKKMTAAIVKAQIDGKKPPYKVRQAMSLFMNTNLSSELSPQNIQAAQAVFAQKKQDQQQATAPKKQSASSTKSLTKSDQAYLTGNQAREKRMAKI